MERQMDAGALRRVPIAAAVRCFVGGMLASILVRAIIPQPDTATLSRDEMVTTAVEVFCTVWHMNQTRRLAGSPACAMGINETVYHRC
jgi:hypothetical protein